MATLGNDPNIVVGEVWPIETYAEIRFNSIQPPFNNLKARQAVAHAVSQRDYMTASYGDAKWRECYSFWVCGTPNGTEVGSDDYRKPNLDLARQLVKESGYNGDPVVLIGGSDIPAYQRASLVTADLLKKIGFNVDLQMSDWGTVAARRVKKDSPSKGGWNLFHTSANGAQVASPLTSPSTIMTCDGKNFPGWPCDQVRRICGCNTSARPIRRSNRRCWSDASPPMGGSAIRAAGPVHAAVPVAQQRQGRPAEQPRVLEHRENLDDGCSIFR